MFTLLNHYQMMCKNGNVSVSYSWVKKIQKIPQPSLRPSCGMIRLPIVLCNWFTLLPYQPPEPEQTDGISHHNQALRPIGETDLCGTYDTGHQHHVVEQRHQRKPTTHRHRLKKQRLQDARQENCHQHGAGRHPKRRQCLRP